MKPLLSLMLIVIFLTQSSAQDIKTAISDSSYSRSIEAVRDTLKDYTLFDDDELMHLNLSYDITSFIRNKMKGEYLDVEMEVTYKDYYNKKDIRLKARGNNRREQCFFPPIYLNFKTDPIEHSELEGMKKVKLVTHCNNSKSYQEYILKEYLIYKLYNILSDYSFRVKLLEIDYKDTGKRKRNYSQYGFLIEPIDLLAKRNNAVEIEAKLIPATEVEPFDTDVAALFQYMIGNTDWRIKVGHNTKFVKSMDVVSTHVIPVPYDFDFSGFVGTYYAFPQEWTSIQSIYNREYLGYCRDDEQYIKVVKHFLMHKDDINSTVASFSHLSEKTREVLLNYLDSFFEMLEDEDWILNTLKDECRDLTF